MTSGRLSKSVSDAANRLMELYTISGEKDPTPLAATECQFALRAELLKLKGCGPSDHRRPLTFQTLDGAPRYQEGRVTGFYATIQGTPPIAELLVREGEGNEVLIDLASGGGRWYRVSMRYGLSGVVAKKYKDLAWSCWEVLQEIRGGAV
jgi:hypothetical protein